MPCHAKRPNPLRYADDQLMKLTQKKCSSKLPKTKSANALLTHVSAQFIEAQSTARIPLIAELRELLPVLWVCLHPQTRREDKLSHRSAETREEGIEWLWSHD
jgi:hypothetical protein